MTPNEALAAFYARHRFQPGKRSWFVGVYVGCMLVPLPNIEARHRYIRQHDLHHIVTGYGVGRIGEGEVSAWELGTGSMATPTVGFMNLIALSTGFALAPSRILAAFRRGLAGRNLYPADRRAALYRGDYPTLERLRESSVDVRPARSGTLLAGLEIATYIALAAFIHAGLVLPAILLRTITDFALGMNLIPKIGKPAAREAIEAARSP